MPYLVTYTMRIQPPQKGDKTTQILNVGHTFIMFASDKDNIKFTLYRRRRFRVKDSKEDGEDAFTEGR